MFYIFPPTAQLDAKNQEIEHELDDISVGVHRLKNVAQEMQQVVGIHSYCYWKSMYGPHPLQELDHQDNLIEDIETGMTKTEMELKNLNKRMKKTLNRVRKGDKFLMGKGREVWLKVFLPPVSILLNVLKLLPLLFEKLSANPQTLSWGINSVDLIMLCIILGIAAYIYRMMN